jgi:hypothetical protein
LLKLDIAPRMWKGLQGVRFFGWKTQRFDKTALFKVILIRFMENGNNLLLNSLFYFLFILIYPLIIGDNLLNSFFQSFSFTSYLSVSLWSFCSTFRISRFVFSSRLLLSLSLFLSFFSSYFPISMSSSSGQSSRRQTVTTPKGMDRSLSFRRRASVALRMSMADGGTHSSEKERDVSRMVYDGARK